MVYGPTPHLISDPMLGFKWNKLLIERSPSALLPCHKEGLKAM